MIRCGEISNKKLSNGDDIDGYIGPSEASSTRQVVEDVNVSESKVTITANDTVSGMLCSFMLLGEWRRTRVEKGDIFRVILTDTQGTFLKWDVVKQYTDVIEVDDDHNLLVMYPDVLLSGSSIAESVSCVRKTVLLARNPGSGGAHSAPALFGNMIHELFQTLIVMLSENSSRNIDPMQLSMIPDDIVRSKVAALFQVNVTVNDALTVLHEAVPKILDWHKKFFTPVHPSSNRPSSRLSADNVRVSHIQDIEELVWSPCTGLKGKIDVTVGIQLPNKEASIGIVELKTGSSKGGAALSHFAQVALYTLLLSDRYERTVTDGLLSYIPSTHKRRELENGKGSEEPQRKFTPPKPHSVFVKSHRGELVGLVMQRNSVAYYLQPNTLFSQLPPVLRRAPEVCSKCFVQESCMVQNRLIEGGTIKYLGADFDQNIYLRHTDHLEEKHASYYYFWRNILVAEEAEAFMTQNELWTKSAVQRAASGACIANLILVPNDLDGPTQALSQKLSLSIDGKHVQRFAVVEGAESGVEKTRISVGDYVLISVEKVLADASGPGLTPTSCATWKPALSNGFISAICKDFVSVLLDRNLTAWARKQRFPVESLVWRIDGEEMLSSYRTAKGNLDALFLSADEQCSSQLRSMVVNCDTPRFHPLTTSQKAVLEESVSALKKLGVKLNEGQTEALAFCERAQDYMLLLGMPGTGKSMTLAAIVIQAARQGKKVLLCSHTHSAVDNVLLKLLSFGFTDFVRLGRNKNITDVRIKPHLVNVYGASSIEELEKAFSEAAVLGVTCLGVNHPVFSRITAFDLVVVDEASQILQPICIGPLLFAKPKFVLVGDHHQLPPLLRSKRNAIPEEIPSINSIDDHEVSCRSPMKKQANICSEENVSLFRRLNDVHPQAVVSLTQQYRMAKPIMDLANKLVYNDQLSCDKETAEQALYVEPNDDGKMPLWLKWILDPEKHLVFVNVDKENEEEQEDCAPDEAKKRDPEGSRKSVEELNIVTKAIVALCKAGVSSRDITVLSPFRAQVELFRTQFKLRLYGLQDVKIFTIDQYQGRDNECVFVSFVRSKTGAHVGPLLRDWRRLNVAITRAKKKLVFVGSKKILASSTKFLSRMVELVDDVTVSLNKST